MSKVIYSPKMAKRIAAQLLKRIYSNRDEDFQWAWTTSAKLRQTPELDTLVSERVYRAKNPNKPNPRGVA